MENPSGYLPGCAIEMSNALVGLPAWAGDLAVPEVERGLSSALTALSRTS